ncbi:nuclear transport factor 2 family protein [Mycobacterium sp. E740]|uniref:nuclear transport factor 2 family protein n=1 Tax=Mycobacterium sp. E740 TaxID=1834149 RepID=UPI0008023A25|nr:nuclear transport factor 2 family protein [Mycobacterium sp. E740]OBI81998.1 hypothetical protein A5663_15185 [Mycobacterium sp. E740]
MSASAVAVVRRFTAALHNGNLDDACRVLDDGFVLHEAGGLPYSGDHHGPDGFRALLADMTRDMELTRGPLQLEALTEDTVVSRFALTFTARSGRSVTMNLVEIYRVRADKIVELDVYYKDPTAVTALLGS